MNTKVPIKNVYWDERGWICLELANDKTVRFRPADGELITQPTGYFFNDGKYPEVTENGEN